MKPGVLWGCCVQVGDWRVGGEFDDIRGIGGGGQFAQSGVNAYIEWMATMRSLSSMRRSKKPPNIHPGFRMSCYQTSQ